MKVLLRALMLVAIAMLIMGCPNESTSTQETQETVKTPTIRSVSEYFKDNQEITITSTTSGAKIYYTRNNSVPSSSSSLYDAGDKPIITKTTTIRAIAIKEGLVDSEVESATFTAGYHTPKYRRSKYDY